MEWKKDILKVVDGEGLDVVRCEELIMPVFFSDLNPEQRLTEIKELEYKEGNVLICSYPKVGTHWVANVVHFLTSEGPLDEMVSFSPFLMEFLPPDVWAKVDEYNILSSHLDANRLPESYFKNSSKIIIVVRNAKDAVVSMFNHLQRSSKFQNKISWEQTFELYSRGEVPFGSYFDYYKTFEKAMKDCDKPDFLVVHFENLKKDGMNELKRIQKFLNTNNSEERLQQILNKVTIKNLRADVNSGKVKTVLVDGSGNSVLYRKGEIGDWKNYFTVAQNEYFDEILEEKFKDSMFNIEFV